MDSQVKFRIVMNLVVKINLVALNLIIKKFKNYWVEPGSWTQRFFFSLLSTKPFENHFTIFSLVKTHLTL
jgi:hypothetical protein